MFLAQMLPVEGMAFGIDPKVVELVTKAVRKVTDKPVIVKLSPNITDIVEIAKGCRSLVAAMGSVSLIPFLVWL